MILYPSRREGQRGPQGKGHVRVEPQVYPEVRVMARLGSTLNIG